MASNAEQAYEQLKATEGSEEGAGEWFLVDQPLINTFADVTHDHQFIHVDPEKAAERSPFKVTIAHGFLTLSLLPHLITTIPSSGARLEGMVMGMNYGFDKVRFVSPVKVDSRIRARSTVKTVELKAPGAVQVTKTYAIEVEGEDKPAVVADWITRLLFS
jgi:acyl dehydratase